MKQLPTQMEADLAGGVTTHCTCWRLTSSTATLGFTDHDNDLTFEGTTFRAETGLSGSEFMRAAGLSIDTSQAIGALDDAALTEADFKAGKWDNARIEMWRVDWTAVENRIELFRGVIGEIRRGRYAFEVELRGLAHVLNQRVGRTYSRLCGAQLGDSRCGVDLTNSAFNGTGTVAAIVQNRLLTVTGLEAFEPNFFTAGTLTWATGGNSGALSQIYGHYNNLGIVIDLMEAPAAPIAIGDTFAATAGCDKTIATCGARFFNQANFRGFPHMPGEDAIAGYASRDQRMDGGSLFD